MDLRRERAHTFKHMDWYNRRVGEEVLWYEYDEVNSEDHPVYSEGGITRYRRVVAVPVLWVAQEEGYEALRETGAKPTQKIRMAISYAAAVRSGMTNPKDAEERLADVLYYDGEWFMVADFRPRGRLHGDQIIYVDANQVHPGEEWTSTELPFTETEVPEMVTPWDDDYSDYLTSFSKDL